MFIKALNVAQGFKRSFFVFEEGKEEKRDKTQLRDDERYWWWAIAGSEKSIANAVHALLSTKERCNNRITIVDDNQINIVRNLIFAVVDIVKRKSTDKCAGEENEAAPWVVVLDEKNEKSFRRFVGAAWNIFCSFFELLAENYDSYEQTMHSNKFGFIVVMSARFLPFSVVLSIPTEIYLNETNIRSPRIHRVKWLFSTKTLFVFRK